MSIKTRRNGGNVRTPNVSHYDVLLAALPLPPLVGVVASLLGPDVSPAVVGASSLPSLLLLGYALFVAAPTTNDHWSS